MIDYHTHIIYGIDDGSHTLDESLEILQTLENLGFTEVYATPHYKPNSGWTADNQKKLQILNKIRKAAKIAGINLKLHLGNEIYIDENIIKNIKTKKIKSLHGKQLLFELPFNEKMPGYRDIINELQVKGYKLILAHPERYIYFQKNHTELLEIKKLGVEFQMNYGSIVGLYGYKVKKLAKFLLKNGYINYFGTDTHHYDPKTFKKIQRAIKKTAKYL